MAASIASQGLCHMADPLVVCRKEREPCEFPFDPPCS
jgi:hypothetical protein